MRSIFEVLTEGYHFHNKHSKCKSSLLIGSQMFECELWEWHTIHQWQGIIDDKQVKINWIEPIEDDIISKVNEIFQGVKSQIAESG